MLSKKSLSSVIATALLLVATIVSIISFQTWFNNYSSSTFVNVEGKDFIGDLNVDVIVGDIMYVYSDVASSINVLKVTGSNGVEVCNLENGTLYFDDSSTRLLYNFDSSYVNATHVLDLSKYNNHGVIQNDVSCIGSGINSEGCYFDGSGDAIDISFSQSLNFTNGMSISFWTNYTGIDGWYKAFEDGGCWACGSFDITVEMLNGSIRYQYWNRNSSDDLGLDGTDYNYLNNTWYHVVGVYDNSYLRIYVNGVDRGVYYDGFSDELSGNLKENGGITRIGGGAWAGGNSWYKGSMDEVSLYGRAITQNEISRLYSSRKALFLENFGVGLNQVNVGSCNLVVGQKYNVFLITDKQTIHKTFIAK